MDVLNLHIIPLYEIIIRVVLACFMGFIIGYDRKKKHKPIGLQSYAIIALSSCLIAIMAQEIYAQYASADHVITLDLGKIIAGVLTGIGFLGAGAIIKRTDSEEVIGSATGASIWASGGIGLMLGFGFYSLSIIATLSIMVVLTLSGKFYRKLK